MSNVRLLAHTLTETRALLRERDDRIEHLLERLDTVTEQLEQLQHYIRELERQISQHGQEEDPRGT